MGYQGHAKPVSRLRRVRAVLRRRRGRVAGLAVPLAVLAGAVAVIELIGRGDGGVVERPIDPRQQTALAFGERSHWLQPWRAYLDTVPADRLRNAIGINFNVSEAEAPGTARMLAESGFRRARLEIGWSSIDYANTSRLRRPAYLKKILGALRDNGIRPLILLNANHNYPGPTRFFDLTVTRAAPQGARIVQLDAKSAARVIPRRTGLNRSDGKAADVIFTAVRPDGTATLARPLPEALEAGRHAAATLRFVPFTRPLLLDGRPNPSFERTLAGWLRYVGTVTRAAQEVMGSQRFDVEIWNELTFGSDFLFAERYFGPSGKLGSGDAPREILERTVRFIRDPRNGVPRVGIGNGFANQTPFDAGSTSPRGLTAIDKHPYYPLRRFPEDAVYNAIAPLDAVGRPRFEVDGRRGREPIRRDGFTPEYDSFFPEYPLTAIQTEHLVRDLSPITTSLYDTPHGRRTRPKASQAPEMWITETNLDPAGSDPSNPLAPAERPLARMSPSEVERMQAKAALRYYTAFVNKGVAAMFLYAAKDPNLGLVDPAFFAALKSGSYPGADRGGETPRAVARLVRALEGPPAQEAIRPLSLLRIADDRGGKQFEGDGSETRPALYDRDVVGFFPFQTRAGEYVCAAYVMTRSLARRYDGDTLDLPEETFRLTIGGLGPDTLVTASDPLTARGVAVKVISRGRDRIEVELPLTDSPRLLKLRPARRTRPDQ